MRKLIVLLFALNLLVACTVKYTQINVNNTGEGDQKIDLDGTTVNTETDQKADGQLDSNVDTGL